MTYGIKKTLDADGKIVRIFATTGEWESTIFFGAGAYCSAKEWKTRAGAQRAADRHHGEVFTITDNTMNY